MENMEINSTFIWELAIAFAWPHCFCSSEVRTPNKLKIEGKASLSNLVMVRLGI